MSSEGSVTRWLGPLQAGDPAAAQQLWQHYFRRTVRRFNRSAGSAICSHGPG